MPIEVDSDTARWGVGIAFAGAVSAIAALWHHLTGRISAVEKEARTATADLWNVINAERDNSSKFRMDITSSVSRLPTREEFDRRLNDVVRDIKDTIRSQDR